ncbi:MAG: alpha/beta hydrolase [Demequina sp.]|uniref:alpha/beta fold hydrolase n=1 Tax=Demequina sp. TaxID=2050685 RepID=UPI0019B23CAB|nr:alpha/beta hydrolase [Demequina sp.]MBC7297672.1 alpha/beta hydrolase [Demequina sp.]
MSSHDYRTVDVPVEGGALRVGVWEPIGEHTADVLMIHGVTSSHLAFPFVARHLPGVRVIAPDLRGRGRSSEVEGPAGMDAHARDMGAVLDHFAIDRLVVVGHSMGGFVAVVTAHHHSDRVTKLVLIDGGIPFDVPAQIPPDDLVAALLGPTAERLSMRFADEDAYLALWREHPAFVADWTDELEDYVRYDLVPDGDQLRPATRYDVVVHDTADLATGSAIRDALAALHHPTRLVTVWKGLVNERPGLYAPEYLERALPLLPTVTHERIDRFNHYTIVLSPAGGALMAQVIGTEIDAAAQEGTQK